MLSRFTDPLPMERRNKCRVFCAREWRVRRRKTAAQLISLSSIEVLFRGRMDGHVAGNSVFRNRLVHLMQVSAGPLNGAELRIG